MAENGTIAYITQVKLCDFCKLRQVQRPAEYDFRTSNGQWANGCEKHYLDNRMHEDLGLGKGQKLVVRP